MHICMLLYEPENHMNTRSKNTGLTSPRKASSGAKRAKVTAKKKPRSRHLAVASPSGTAFEVKRFCRRYQLIRPDLTRLTGYSLRSVDKWAGGETPSGPARKQLTELTRLFDALCEIMDPESIGQWLKAPNQAFEGSTPLQVIERGETDRIWRMIYLIETGEPI